jgi:hypothetical protein
MKSLSHLVASLKTALLMQDVQILQAHNSFVHCAWKGHFSHIYLNRIWHRWPSGKRVQSLKHVPWHYCAIMFALQTLTSNQHFHCTLRDSFNTHNIYSEMPPTIWFVHNYLQLLQPDTWPQEKKVRGWRHQTSTTLNLTMTILASRQSCCITHSSSHLLAANSRCTVRSGSSIFFCKYWLIWWPIAVERSTETRKVSRLPPTY